MRKDFVRKINKNFPSYDILLRSECISLRLECISLRLEWSDVHSLKDRLFHSFLRVKAAPLS